MLDLLLVGEDQPQADQPNSLVEGLPLYSNLISGSNLTQVLKLMHMDVCSADRLIQHDLHDVHITDHTLWRKDKQQAQTKPAEFKCAS
eukprot:1159051-Pelagomonas_calceolata.AAC.2